MIRRIRTPLQGALLALLALCASLTAAAPPVIDYFSPTGGPAGTEVRLVGANLAPETLDVRIGNLALEVQGGSDEEVRVTIPAGATTDPLRVLTADGEATTAERFIVSPLTLTLTPTAVNLPLERTAPFTALVAGGPSALVWSVAGSDGGDAVHGTITQGTPAIYQAPDTLPPEPVVRVAVRAVANPAVQAIAEVRLIDPAGGVPDLPLTPADPAHFSVEPEIFQPVSRTRLMVMLREGASLGPVLAAAGTANARVVGGLPDIGTAYIEIPDSNDHSAIRALVATLAALPAVEAVAHDALISATALPPATPGTLKVLREKQVYDFATDFIWDWTLAPSRGNWGLEYANFPQVWNLKAHVGKFDRRIEVGLSDTRTFRIHPDLSGAVIWEGATDSAVTEGHGSHVAGTIAATWGDGKGIDGASPFAVIASQPSNGGIGMGTWGTFFTSLGDILYGQMRRLIQARPDVRVINSSQGYNWKRNGRKNWSYDGNGDGNYTDPGDYYLPALFSGQPDPAAGGEIRVTRVPSTPDNNPVIRAFVEAQGKIARRVAWWADPTRHPESGRNVMFVVSAGNDRWDIAGQLHSDPAQFDDPNIPARAAQWNVISAQYNSPMAWAAYNGTNNVIVVEALDKTDNRANIIRAEFSGIANDMVGAQFYFSAPGVDVLSSVPLWEKPDGTFADEVATGASRFSGYAEFSGTSMAAPHVSGLVAWLLSVDPELTTAQVLECLRQTSRGGGGGGGAAPAIDAFAAMVYIDSIRAADPGKRKWVQKALVNIDDGSLDGNDRLVTADAHGSGIAPPAAPTWRIDMADFRRFRDALLQVQARGAFLDGPLDSLKRDLNGDRLIQAPTLENVYPRVDFNGDGVATADDLAVMADPDLWNDAQIDDSGMSAAALLAELTDLIDSGDLKLDPGTLFAGGGIDRIHVTAKVTLGGGVTRTWQMDILPEHVAGAAGDLRRVLTVPSGKPVRILAAGYQGAVRRFFVLPPEATTTLTVEPGSDRELRLAQADVRVFPEQIVGRYQTNLNFDLRFQIEGASVAMDPEFYQVAFTVPSNLGTISAASVSAASSFNLSTGSTPGRYSFQAVVTDADGESILPADQPALTGAVTVRTAVIRAPAGLALDSVGNQYVSDSDAGTVTFIPPGGFGRVILSGLDQPGDVEVDSRGRSLLVAQAEGKVGRYYFGLTGTVRDAAGALLTGALVHVETPAGTLPGDASPENAFRTNDNGEFHVPDLLAPAMGGGAPTVVVTVSHRGQTKAWPVELNPVGPTFVELVFTE